MSATPIRVLGAMSGTSSDGVDIAALEISESPFRISYLGLVSVDFPDAFRETLLTLQNPQQAYSEGDDPFALLASARNELSVCYAQAVKRLLTQLSWEASTVMALGAHGQTIRHNPDAGYTLQILDPALIRHLTGLRVVSDFRSADVALGGQGAPLVPAFHQAWLKSANAFTEVPVCVLNLGGFSNLTILNAKGEVTQGGDCGPANVFLDWFAQQHLNTRCD
ncbi:MAG: anhydro-N-acetylmuramic acid kinase, partial [Limnobacter sp.]|nr:anhydro-N-acetylmuramic acid kinase [Limnobacter sp.]